MNGYMRPPKVCLCKNVTKEQIIKAIKDGNVTFEQIQLATRASTGCGTCANKVQKILKETLEQ